MTQRHLFSKLTVMVALITGGLLMQSCKEENIIPTPSFSVNEKFVGTFVGVSGCDTGTASITFNAGTDQHSAFMHAVFGQGDCKLITTIQATINGDSLRIPFQEYQDHCFNNFSVSGGATYRNDSIFLAFTSTFTTDLNVDSTRTCYFMGKKLPDDNGHNSSEDTTTVQ